MEAARTERTRAYTQGLQLAHPFQGPLLPRSLPLLDRSPLSPPLLRSSSSPSVPASSPGTTAALPSTMLLTWATPGELFTLFLIASQLR
jgi:hypothetical protein